jgi:hypothetical protein
MKQLLGISKIGERMSLVKKNLITLIALCLLLTPASSNTAPYARGLVIGSAVAASSFMEDMENAARRSGASENGERKPVVVQKDEYRNIAPIEHDISPKSDDLFDRIAPPDDGAPERRDVLKKYRVPLIMGGAAIAITVMTFAAIKFGKKARKRLPKTAPVLAVQQTNGEPSDASLFSKPKNREITVGTDAPAGSEDISRSVKDTTERTETTAAGKAREMTDAWKPREPMDRTDAFAGAPKSSQATAETLEATSGSAPYSPTGTTVEEKTTAQAADRTTEKTDARKPSEPMDRTEK